MTDSGQESPRRKWGWANPVYQDLYPAHYGDPDNYGIGICPRWADHQDLLERDGRVIYVAHPYVLDGEALDDLARLRAGGWKIRVTGSEYYPGRSVQVSLEWPS